MAGGDTIKVEVVAAWPRHHVARTLRLPAGATVADAVDAASIGAVAIGAASEGAASTGERTAGAPAPAFDGVAIHGERVSPDRVLATGDRVELLRPLQVDPKEARRRRASGATGDVRGSREGGSR